MSIFRWNAKQKRDENLVLQQGLALPARVPIAESILPKARAELEPPLKLHPVLLTVPRPNTEGQAPSRRKKAKLPKELVHRALAETLSLQGVSDAVIEEVGQQGFLLSKLAFTTLTNADVASMSVGTEAEKRILLVIRDSTTPLPPRSHIPAAAGGPEAAIVDRQQEVYGPPVPFTVPPTYSAVPLSSSEAELETQS